VFNHNYKTNQLHSPIHSSMVLQPFVGPWPLLQFRNIFYTDGRTPWRVISPSQDHYLHTGQHKHRINAHTNVHALSGIRIHDPSVSPSEGSKKSTSIEYSVISDSYKYILREIFKNNDKFILQFKLWNFVTRFGTQNCKQNTKNKAVLFATSEPRIVTTRLSN
jgi:hypothetical protein